MRPSSRLALIALAIVTAIAALPSTRTAAQTAKMPFDALHFRDIGPAATGGRIHDLQIDPKNPAVLYVGAASGGIWKSTNKGLTWRDIFGKQPDNTFGALAIFAGDSKIIWAGTGEQNNRQSSSWGGGVYRSDRRRGRHGRISACMTPGPSAVSFSIRSIRTSPTSRRSVILWAGNPDRGVFKTADAGSHVVQSAVRRYVHRRHRSRHGSA
jgi:hypothetical protein